MGDAFTSLPFLLPFSFLSHFLPRHHKRFTRVKSREENTTELPPSFRDGLCPVASSSCECARARARERERERSGRMERYDPEQGDGVKPPSSAGVGDGSVWEIEEEVASEDALEPRLQHGVVSGEEVEDVYVAVGKGGSSMDALSWALRHAAKPSSFVYLVHVFPEVHHIPTPLGMLPRNQVTPQQVESHMSQERSKRRELLQKYLNLCHNSKVNVDTCLIESDLVGKAILELIPVLHIKRLIMGTSKSNLRMLKKGNGKVRQVLRDAPTYCEVKIICEGKEVRVTIDELTSSPSPPNPKVENKGEKGMDEDRKSDVTSCNCFSRKFM